MSKIVTLILSMTTLFWHSAFAGEGISLSEAYQNNSSLQWNWAIDGLDHFSFDEADKILDVGSGDGKITAHIANLVAEGTVVGLDISPQMVATATDSFSLPNLIFIQASATAIPFRNQFDKVVSFCTLHWVLDQKAALQAVYDALKPNGMALLVLPGKNPCNLGAGVERVVVTDKWKAYFSDYTPLRFYYTQDEYLQLLRQVGFSDVSGHSKRYFEVFPSREALTTWINPLINFADHLTPEQRSDFINDLVDDKIRHCVVGADGSIPVPQLKLDFIITK